MSGAAASAAPLGRYVSASRIGDFGIAFVVFLGGFVIYEPAPYELVLAAVMGAAIFAGLRISRAILQLIVLLLLYVTGGVLAVGEVEDLSKPLIYLGTTVLLVFSAIFFASVIPTDPERRLRLIVRAYTAGAVIAAIIGILGYFAGIEFLTLYGRARGPFQDPNVFGPFLVLPFVYLIHGVLGRPLRKSFWPAIAATVILIAIVLSFSRAAWGMAALAVMIAAALAFINQRSGSGRLRVVGFIVVGAILVVAIVGLLLALPATSSLFAERAQLVQSYDIGALGRFERQQLGFLLAFDKPLGIGPFAFGKMFGEDEHNMWLKGFMVYGWLGGFAYLALVVWTLTISLPLVFKPRPWRGIVVAAFAVYLGHLLIHNVIDNDHWRHLFLIYGVLWGLTPRSACSTAARRSRKSRSFAPRLRGRR